jgi:transcriptional regulator with PAS, ATPase and Fis domain
LRERGDDVLLLADYYIAKFNKSLRRYIKGLSPEAETIFRNHNWPGNVRELGNCIERSMILEDSALITPQYLPYGMTKKAVQHHASNLQIGLSINKSNKKLKNTVSLFKLPEEGLILNEIEQSLVQQAIA